METADCYALIKLAGMGHSCSYAKYFKAMPYLHFETYFLDMEMLFSTKEIKNFSYWRDEDAFIETKRSFVMVLSGELI